MASLERYERQFKILEQLQTDIGLLDNLEATPENRSKLSSLIKYCTDELNFTRIDKDKVVNLYYYNPSLGLSPEITIGLHDNKFSIDSWSLWKVMHGLQESIQEMKAEQYR